MDLSLHLPDDNLMGCVEDMLRNDDFEFVAFNSFLDVDYSFSRSLHLFFGASRNGLCSNFALLYLRVHLDLLMLSFLRSDLACFVAFRMRLLHKWTPCFLYGEHHTKYTCALVEVKTCSFLFLGVLIGWYRWLA